MGLAALILGEAAAASLVLMAGEDLVAISAGTTCPGLSAVLSLSLNEEDSLESLRLPAAADGLAGPVKAG